MTRFNSSDPNNRSGDVPYPDGWEDLLVSYALGDLSPQEEEAFQQLLKNYPELTPDARAFQASVDSLPLALPELSPPQTLEAQVLATAQSTPQQLETSQPSTQPSSSNAASQSVLASESFTSNAGAADLRRGDSASAASAQSQRQRVPVSKASAGAPPSFTSSTTQVRWVDPARSRRQSRAVVKRNTGKGSRTEKGLTRQPWTKSWGSAIAAAAIAALLGMNNVQLRSQLGQSARENAGLQTRLDTQTAELARLEDTNIRDQAILTTLRQPNTLMYELKGTGDALTAFGSLLAVPDHSEVALIAQNLPPLLQSQVYRLWAVATPTAQPMYCGEFPESVEGTAVWTVPDNVCSNAPAKMIITVDAANDPPVPKGPAILQSTLQ